MKCPKYLVKSQFWIASRAMVKGPGTISGLHNKAKMSMMTSHILKFPDSSITHKSKYLENRTLFSWNKKSKA